MQTLDYRSTRDIPLSDVLLIYGANGWSAAEKPELLQKALLNSETLARLEPLTRRLGDDYD